MTNLINELLACKDQQTKNRVISALLHNLDCRLTAEEKASVLARIRDTLRGNHFDADSAKERIARMYYATEDGSIVSGPFVSDRDGIEFYNEYRAQIKSYNLYDFLVVLNDTIANFHNLLYTWWENEDWDIMLIKFSEIAVNWLNDDDTPYHGDKAWRVLGGE